MTVLVVAVLLITAVLARRLRRPAQLRVSSRPTAVSVVARRVDAAVLEQLQPPFQHAAQVLRQRPSS